MSHARRLPDKTICQITFLPNVGGSSEFLDASIAGIDSSFEPEGRSENVWAIKKESKILYMYKRERKIYILREKIMIAIS